MGFYMLDNPNPNTPQGVLPRRGTRGQLTGTAIIHTSESVLDRIGPDSTAEDCASFIGRRTDYGCYHTLVDSDSIIEMYPYEWETWQDSETNNWAVGLSVAIRASEWNTVPEDQKERLYRNIASAAADFVIYMRVAHNIEVPRKRISGDAARAGEPGFCAHGDSGLYRTDPGADFEWDRFFKYIEEALTGTPEEEDEDMIWLAKRPDSDTVYVGNGVTRTKINSNQTLLDIKHVWRGRIGNNGEVAVYDNIEAIGPKEV